MNPANRVPARVYFIRPVGQLGPIKIGVSQTPEARLSSLMTWSPVLLEIVAMIPGDATLESKIQRRLFRSHSHREWFHPTPEVVGLVEALRAGVALADALDFTAPSGSIRSAALRGKSPTLRKYMSYFHRVRFALGRAAKAEGVDRFLQPKSVYEALERIKRGSEFTERDVALLEDCIANPASYGRPYNRPSAPRVAA